jgi:hypothetical protein
MSWHGDTFVEVVASGVIMNGRWVDFRNPQPWPLHPDTAVFHDFGDRITLGKLGIFSIDRNKETGS